MKNIGVLLFLSLMVLFSCSPRVEYVPVRYTVTDSTHTGSHREDRGFEKDSIFKYIFEKGDTVYNVEYRYKFRDRKVKQHDTVYITHTDSIPVPYPVEVEKPLTLWSSIKIRIGGVAILTCSVLAIFSVLYILIKRFRK